MARKPKPKRLITATDEELASLVVAFHFPDGTIERVPAREVAASEKRSVLELRKIQGKRGGEKASAKVRKTPPEFKHKIVTLYCRECVKRMKTQPAAIAESRARAWVVKEIQERYPNIGKSTIHAAVSNAIGKKSMGPKKRNDA